MAKCKTQGYTLLDDFYFGSMCVLVDELNRFNIPYAIVGGAAYQIKMAGILSKDVKGDISSVQGLEGILRGTGDIDLTIKSDMGRMVNLLNQMAASCKHINIETQPSKSVRFKKGNDSVYVNYQTEPADVKALTEHYDKIIETAEEVYLRKGNKDSYFKIPSMPYLIVSKVLRREEKDKVDIFNLLGLCRKKNIKLNFEEVRSILKSIGKEDSFDYIKKIFYDL